jgi:F-type H+-transporting ATPase subunit alpha
MTFNLDIDEVGTILLDKSEHLKAGDEVRRTGRVLDVPVGDGLLGRVVDPMGRPLDNQGQCGRHKGIWPSEKPQQLWIALR